MCAKGTDHSRPLPSLAALGGSPKPTLKPRSRFYTIPAPLPPHLILTTNPNWRGGTPQLIPGVRESTRKRDAGVANGKALSLFGRLYCQFICVKKVPRESQNRADNVYTHTINYSARGPLGAHVALLCVTWWYLAGMEGGRGRKREQGDEYNSCGGSIVTS
ncbi:hypothetical protein DFH09DRAFT_1110943 [Mycena vulgaris]|nr:hypothetical protein DFH09DRAFT_1110943 [Mycena vulgaris]